MANLADTCSICHLKPGKLKAPFGPQVSGEMSQCRGSFQDLTQEDGDFLNSAPRTWSIGSSAGCSNWFSYFKCLGNQSKDVLSWRKLREARGRTRIQGIQNATGGGGSGGLWLERGLPGCFPCWLLLPSGNVGQIWLSSHWVATQQTLRNACGHFHGHVVCRARIWELAPGWMVAPVRQIKLGPLSFPSMACALPDNLC